MDEARPLDIEIGATGDIRVVRLGGELDLASVPRLTELLVEVAAPRVILDLSGLAFIDSSGVAALVRAQQQMDEGGQTLTLTAPEPYRCPGLRDPRDFVPLGYRHLRLTRPVEVAR